MGANWNCCVAAWSSGMILVLGKRGHGFDSRSGPFFMVKLLVLFQNWPLIFDPGMWTHEAKYNVFLCLPSKRHTWRKSFTAIRSFQMYSKTNKTEKERFNLCLPPLPKMRGEKWYQHILLIYFKSLFLWIPRWLYCFRKIIQRMILWHLFAHKFRAFIYIVCDVHGVWIQL